MTTYQFNVISLQLKIPESQTSSYGDYSYDFWLVKTDSDGNEVWNRTFEGISSDLAYSVQQTSDGGYILTGYTFSYGAGPYDLWLVKADSDGNEVWNRTFGGTDGDLARAVQQTSDGGYILAGDTYSYGAGNHDFWLVKTDSDGNEVWNMTFGGGASDKAYFVQQTSDSGYILAGETSSYSAGSGDFWLVKTDSDGNKVWEKTFGGTNYDCARSVQQTTDGGYILAGYTYSYGAGGYDAWLIKVGGESAELRVHNIDKGTDYSTIQVAIDDADIGDEIHVDSGTYYENVAVDKQLTLRGIDTGEGMPVVDAGGSGSGIELWANGMAVEGFIITNYSNIPYNYREGGIFVDSNDNTLINNIIKKSVSHRGWGIVLCNSHNNTLINNTISNNTLGGTGIGIKLDHANNNTLIDNIVWNNSVGISLGYSSNNMLTSSIVSNNIQHGVYLYYSSNNMFINNALMNNTGQGIVLHYSSNNNNITNNIALNNTYGIYVGTASSSSTYNVLTNNIASNNSYHGIYIGDSDYNIIKNNTVMNNGLYGIIVSCSEYNTLTNNIASNNYIGIRLHISSNNILYHNNLINNINYNAYSYTSHRHNLSFFKSLKP